MFSDHTRRESQTDAQTDTYYRLIDTDRQRHAQTHVDTDNLTQAILQLVNYQYVAVSYHLFVGDCIEQLFLYVFMFSIFNQETTVPSL